MQEKHSACPLSARNVVIINHQEIPFILYREPITLKHWSIGKTLIFPALLICSCTNK